MSRNVGCELYVLCRDKRNWEGILTHRSHIHDGRQVFVQLRTGHSQIARADHEQRTLNIFWWAKLVTRAWMEFQKC